MPVVVDGKSGSYRRTFDNQGFLEVDSAQRHDPTSAKIIFWGDSTTFGYGVSVESTFVELIDHDFPAFDAINLGVVGYTSYQGYQTLIQRGLPLHPKLIVVSFNFNDRRYVLDAHKIDSVAWFRQLSWSYRFSLWQETLFHSATYRLLQALFLSKEAREDAGASKYLGARALQSLFPRVAPEQYRANLVNMVEVARRYNIPLLFLLLRDNPQYTARLHQGITSLEEGQDTSAIQALEKAIDDDNMFSDLARSYLSDLYEKQGWSAEKAAVAIIPKVRYSIHGWRPLYRDSDYTSIMQEIAKQYHIEVVNAADILDQDPTSHYLDFCHPTVEGHQHIAGF